MSVLHDRLAMQNQTIEELKSQRDQARDALDDIRDACGREGSTMTPSEVSQLAVERIATLEHQARYCADETKQALAELAAGRERSAALAVALESVRDILENAPELNPSNYDHEQACELNSKMVEACLFLRHNPPSAILAAHNAEVERKAKVEALEDEATRLRAEAKIRENRPTVNRHGSADLEEAQALEEAAEGIETRIAALKGGKG